VQTYLQRDVRDLARVGDEMAFLRFLRAAAARSAQLLNLSDLARDADVAVNTAKHWLSILETSGIVHLLPPFHGNVTKRLVKAPKLYFLDTGLCAFLTQWSTPETLEAGAMGGAMLETWVVSEIIRSWWHAGVAPNCHFYRDLDGREIDVLITADGALHPVEIKKTAGPSPEAVRHFPTLARFGMPVAKGALLCLVPRSVALTRDVDAVPVW
jgi:predicted AAA+ superfamily ATPase